MVPGEGAYRGNLGYGARDPVAGVDAVFFVGTDALDRPPEEGDLLRVDGRAPGATEPAWRVYKVSRDDTGAVYQRVSSGMQYAVACKDADGEAW